MTLPSSFPISASQINVELGRSAGAAFDIQGSEERGLAGVPSGAISMSDFFGKSGQDAAYVDVNTDSGNGTNVSITANIGAAATNRRVVAVINWIGLGGDSSLTSASIGGVAATIHVQRHHSGGSSGLGVAIISAIVPTGTTATVSYSFDIGVSRSRVGTFRLNRYGTIVATASDQLTGTTGGLSATVTTVSNGFVVAGYSGSTGTVAVNIVWSNVTENYEVADAGRMGGASVAVSSGSLTVQATQGVITNSGNDLVVVSFGA